MSTNTNRKALPETEAGQEPLWTPFVGTGQITADPRHGLPDGTIYQNSRYLVVVRDLSRSPAAALLWLSIKRIDNRPARVWRDLQRIKNELVGPEAEGVELFPAESRLVDNANQTHLWCLPNSQFPFGFAERLVSEGTAGVSQRPFAPDNRPADLSEVNLADLDFTVTSDAPTLSGARFPLGDLVATPDALEALQAAGESGLALLARHRQGDWGEVDASDWQANDRALGDGARLLSAYTLPTGVRLWVITEADRSATTILLPSDY